MVDWDLDDVAGNTPTLWSLLLSVVPEGVYEPADRSGG